MFLVFEQLINVFLLLGKLIINFVGLKSRNLNLTQSLHHHICSHHLPVKFNSIRALKNISECVDILLLLLNRAVLN